jgi:hypothetical protein
LHSQDEIDSQVSLIIGPLATESEVILRGCSIVIAGYSLKMARNSSIICEVEECEINIRMRSHFTMIGCPQQHSAHTATHARTHARHTRTHARTHTTPAPAHPGADRVCRGTIRATTINIQAAEANMNFYSRLDAKGAAKQLVINGVAFAHIRPGLTVDFSGARFRQTAVPVSFVALRSHQQ